MLEDTQYPSRLHMIGRYAVIVEVVHHIVVLRVHRGDTIGAQLAGQMWAIIHFARRNVNRDAVHVRQPHLAVGWPAKLIARQPIAVAREKGESLALPVKGDGRVWVTLKARTACLAARELDRRAAQLAGEVLSCGEVARSARDDD